MKWQDKLTKTEMRHLKKDAFDPGVQITLDDIKKTFEAHAKMRRKDPRPTSEPCWECKKIARKLGFEV